MRPLPLRARAPVLMILISPAVTSTGALALSGTGAYKVDTTGGATTLTSGGNMTFGNNQSFNVNSGSVTLNVNAGQLQLGTGINVSSTGSMQVNAASVSNFGS